MSKPKESYTVTPDYVKSFRDYLRIATDRLDGELKDLIHAAQSDLILGGVLPIRATDEKDPLIKRAIATYVKAEFGLDNPDAEQYRAAYFDIKRRLLLADEYIKPKEG